jgi:capsular polysaccharide biosynthesis protein
MAALTLRFKIFCYSLLEKLRRSLVRVARVLPGCWTVFGIPRREIPDVAQWIRDTAANNGDRGGTPAPSYRTIGNDRQVLRLSQAPPGVDGVHPDLLQPHFQYRAPVLALIPLAHIVGPHGALITPEGGILMESCYGAPALRQDDIYRTLALPRPQFMEGSYYTIASLAPAGYYHWVIETIPRLFAFEEISPRPRLIVNSPLNSWQLESLELLGFPRDELIELDGNHLQLEQLYFPEYIGINPHALSWLRDQLFAAVPLEPIDPQPRRIYITRRLTEKRRLANEDQIEPLLAEHGFMIAELETMTFAQQVRLFAQAEIVVGVHGAGLTNLAWAPPGCKVMEIQHPDYVNVMYYMLAEVLEQRYWSCLGTSAGDDSLLHGGTHGHGHLTVAVDLFRKVLSEMLEAKEG